MDADGRAPRYTGYRWWCCPSGSWRQARAERWTDARCHWPALDGYLNSKAGELVPLPLPLAPPPGPETERADNGAGTVTGTKFACVALMPARSLLEIGMRRRFAGGMGLNHTINIESGVRPPKKKEGGRRRERKEERGRGEGKGGRGRRRGEGARGKGRKQTLLSLSLSDIGCSRRAEPCINVRQRIQVTGVRVGFFYGPGWHARSLDHVLSIAF